MGDSKPGGIIAAASKCPSYTQLYVSVNENFSDPECACVCLFDREPAAGSEGFGGCGSV